MISLSANNHLNHNSGIHLLQIILISFQVCTMIKNNNNQSNQNPQINLLCKSTTIMTEILVLKTFLLADLAFITISVQILHHTIRELLNKHTLVGTVSFDIFIPINEFSSLISAILELDLLCWLSY